MSAQSSDNRIKFGVLLPTREAVMSGRADPSLLYRLAERAEELGFDSVWVGDSLTARPRIDALTTLAAVGARTKRVRLGTAIYLAALRHPLLLAYQLASLDWLTGGRIDFGIGFGKRSEPSQEHEFAILGLDQASRMSRSEEAVHIMRRLWRENDVAYNGAFTRFEHVTIEPKPAQTGGVPVWLASNDVEAGLRRVGRMGDGWMNNIKSPEVYRLCWDKVRAYAADAGRDPGQHSAGLLFHFGRRRQRRDHRRTKLSGPLLQPLLRGHCQGDALCHRFVGRGDRSPRSLSPSRRAHCRVALRRRRSAPSFRKLRRRIQAPRPDGLRLSSFHGDCNWN